jgi:hypothetical protein
VALEDGTEIRISYLADNQVVLEMPSLAPSWQNLIFTSNAFGKYTYMDMVRVVEADRISPKRLVKYFPKLKLSVRTQQLPEQIESWQQEHAEYSKVACIAYVSKGASQLTRQIALAQARKACLRFDTSQLMVRSDVYSVRTTAWSLDQVMVVLDR